jgi:hypothetical protein
MRRVETQSIRDVAIGKRATEVVGDQRIGAPLAATHDDSHGNAVITDAAHDTITIQNVTTAQLQAHQGDFHLV